jgi:hypothetical protein
LKRLDIDESLFSIEVAIEIEKLQKHGPDTNS